MAKKSKFNYVPPSDQSVKERAEQTGGRFDSIFKQGFDVYKPKVGDNWIRFLPATWEDPVHFGFNVWVHSYIGVNSGSYVCLQKMKEEECPICEMQKKLKKAGEEDESKRYAPTRRVVCWILDRDAEKPTPILFPMSWTADREIAQQGRDRTGKALWVDQPSEGYDLSFKRKGTTKNNTEYFGYKFDRDASPISEDDTEQEGILEYITDNPIPSVLHYVSPEYMASVIEGTAEEKDDELDDDADETPKRKPRNESEQEEHEARGDRRRPRDEDEDDTPPKKRPRDEDEDDTPLKKKPRDEDEDDTPPKKKPRADEDDDPPPKKRPRDEEDDDPPPKKKPRDEEDDDPPPKKKPRTDEDDDPPPKKRPRDEDEDDRPPRRVPRK